MVLNVTRIKSPLLSFADGIGTIVILKDYIPYHAGKTGKTFSVVCLWHSRVMGVGEWFWGVYILDSKARDSGGHSLLSLKRTLDFGRSEPLR